MITPGSPFARAGEVIGTTGRSATMFHQGILVNQTFNKKWSDQFGGDVQIYQHPNQIQLASANDGLVLLVQPGIGIALSGPLPVQETLQLLLEERSTRRQDSKSRD